MEHGKEATAVLDALAELDSPGAVPVSVSDPNADHTWERVELPGPDPAMAASGASQPAPPVTAPAPSPSPDDLLMPEGMSLREEVMGVIPPYA